MQRMGMVIGIRSEKIDAYRRLHAEPWPSVIAALSHANIRNYSIFLREPENLLFGYWEYHGDDFEADAARVADDEETRRWWEQTDPCQLPFPTRRDGEFWAMMDEVFHLD